MRLAPLPHALDVGRAYDVIAVRGCVEPAPLAGGLAGVAACGRGAVSWASGAARVGIKEGRTVLTLALTQWTSHSPASPQAKDQGMGAQKKENGEEKKHSEEERRTRQYGDKYLLGGRRRHGLTANALIGFRGRGM
jgi:hypothetical protein